jgi:hypothetical protein
MSYIDYDVQTELEALQKAIADRKTFKSAKDLAGLRRLDELVCMKSRALYLRYVDTALWRGSIDPETHQIVHDALEKSVACLPDSDYSSPHKPKSYEVWASVNRRFDEFKAFSARLNRQSCAPAAAVRSAKKSF